MENENQALLTDLYQLTMIGGYVLTGKAEQKACFEYFFRNLPPHTGFAILAGVNDAVEKIKNLKFSESDIAYMESLGLFADDQVMEYFRNFKFTGQINHMPEGYLVFPHEPIVQIIAPLPQAQLVETLLLNCINYPTLVATKAARICHAAETEQVLEFGLRRAQGPNGALCGSRAAYIGGCAATSNVLAGKEYGIPVRGTMAHSWVMSFPTEYDAFKAYVKIYPKNPILLVDTYDTLVSGVPNAIKVLKELQEQTGDVVRAGIRLDSGDLAKLSKAAYQMLTEAGFPNPLIVASGDLDEEIIADLKRQEAEINSWGVGTNLITCKDHPALGGVYKLVAIEEDGKWISKIKISANPAKVTTPGRKEVLRLLDKRGGMLGDLICSEEEVNSVYATALQLGRVAMYDTNTFRKSVITGIDVVQRVQSVFVEETSKVRMFVMNQLQNRLAQEYQRLKNPEYYPVGLTASLAEKKKAFVEKE